MRALLAAAFLSLATTASFAQDAVHCTSGTKEQVLPSGDWVELSPGRAAIMADALSQVYGGSLPYEPVGAYYLVNDKYVVVVWKRGGLLCPDYYIYDEESFLILYREAIGEDL